MSELQTTALVDECRRHEENCLYTAVALHLWLADLRTTRAWLAIVPAVAGALAGVGALHIGDAVGQVLGVVGAVTAAVLPAILSALKYDGNIELIQRIAPEFLNLRDRFRQAAEVTSQCPFDEFQREFNHLRDRLERARNEGLTVPDKYFEQARKKINEGHFEHLVDAVRAAN